jgi:hypothetical protein
VSRAGCEAMTDLRDEGSHGRPSLARELIAAGRGERAGRAARLLAADALLTAGVSAAGVAPAARGSRRSSGWGFRSWSWAPLASCPTPRATEQPGRSCLSLPAGFPR